MHWHLVYHNWWTVRSYNVCTFISDLQPSYVYVIIKNIIIKQIFPPTLMASYVVSTTLDTLLSISSNRLPSQKESVLLLAPNLQIPNSTVKQREREDATTTLCKATKFRSTILLNGLIETDTFVCPKTKLPETSSYKRANSNLETSSSTRSTLTFSAASFRLFLPYFSS